MADDPDSAREQADLAAAEAAEIGGDPSSEQLPVADEVSVPARAAWPTASTRASETTNAERRATAANAHTGGMRERYVYSTDSSSVSSRNRTSDRRSRRETCI